MEQSGNYLLLHRSWLTFPFVPRYIVIFPPDGSGDNGKPIAGIIPQVVTTQYQALGFPYSGDIVNNLQSAVWVKKSSDSRTFEWYVNFYSESTPIYQLNKLGAVYYTLALG